MESNPKCTKCNSEHVYSDGPLWICPECAHEWSSAAPVSSEGEVGDQVIRDCHGNELKNGDAVTLIKDLKVKGASSVLKAGTKVRNIRLIDPIDGHDISCKIDEVGQINLKSQFVKKV